MQMFLPSIVQAMDLPAEPLMSLPGKHVSKWSIRLSIKSCTALLDITCFQMWLLFNIPNVLPLCGTGSLSENFYQILLPLFSYHVKCGYFTEGCKETEDYRLIGGSATNSGQVAQGFIQLDLENIQGQRVHDLSGKPVPLPDFF